MISESSQTEAEACAQTRGAWLTFHELLLLLILAAVQFTHIVDFTIIMPLGPVFSREMGLTPLQFGAVVAAYTISAGIAGLLAARFLDRFDRKSALLVLYAGFIAGTLLCAVAPNFLLLLVARTVAGAFGGVVASVVFAIVGDAFPDTRRGTAMGVVLSAFAVASFAGVPLGLFLAEQKGWSSVFAVLGGVSTGVLVVAIVVLPPLRGHLKQGQVPIANAWAVLTDANHLRAFALTSVLILSSFMLGPYLATFLVYNVGVQQEDLKFMYVCGGLATLVTMTVFGRLADRFGKLFVFRTLATFTLVPIVIVTNLPAGLTLPLVLTVTTVFMVTTSGRWVPAMALVAGCAAPAYRGSFMSFNSAVQQIAAGLATAIAGFILDEHQDHLLTGFPLVGLLTCVATIASVYLAGRLRKDPGGELAPDSSAISAMPAAAE
jgi:predicted MFS family arabinose efflux permease